MIPNYLLTTFWMGWRRWAAWAICVVLLFIVSLLRTKTNADLTSFALIPVLVIAWIGGRLNGLIMGFLGVAIWFVGDFLTLGQTDSRWIIWVNATTRLVTYTLVAILSAQVNRQFVKVYEFAITDPLTGLSNRRVFIEDGALEVARSSRYSHSLAVVFLDLDNFKKLNDTQGHDMGDVALQAVAKVLRGNLRSNDRITRLGGDEFAILLPEIGYEEALDTGRKVSLAVNSVLADFQPVTSSMGIAWFSKADRTFPEMLKAADKLMYEVKSSNKGSISSRRFE